MPLDQRTQLGAGQYYVSDLIGCEVWEAGATAAMGAVGDVEFPGGVPLLSVETGDGEVLVPLAAEFCIRIDVQAKRIDVSASGRIAGFESLLTFAAGPFRC